MALTTGVWLGPYEVAAQIGVSGMGEVYVAAGRRIPLQFSRSRCSSKYVVHLESLEKN